MRDHLIGRIHDSESWHLGSSPSPAALLRLRPLDVGFISACGQLNTEKKSLRSILRRAENLMQYFIYILECADKSLYVGCTNNLERRIKQHNDSKWGAHYTKIRRPVELKYKEVFKTLKEARQRETEIKGWRREKKFTLINS